MAFLSALLLSLCVAPLDAFNLPTLAPRGSYVPSVSRSRQLKTVIGMSEGTETPPSTEMEEASEQVPTEPSSPEGQLFESGIGAVTDAPAVSKGKGKIDRMVNENGVAYAPWMVNALASQAEVAAVERDRRDKAQKESTQVFGDVQAQEMAGTGLTTNIINDDVELSWATGDETGNLGYIVQKRAAGGASWSTISSYEDFQPLASKGIQGGTYTYLDPTSEPGSWYYRVMDCDDSNTQNFVCQALVDVQTKEEKFGTLVAVGAFGALMLIATAVGVALDPQ